MGNGWIGFQHALRGFKDITINQSDYADSCAEVLDLIEGNINKVIRKRDFKEAVNRVIYEESWEYIPYKTGQLSGTSDGVIGIDKFVSITSAGIHYKAPYAYYQYEWAYPHDTSVHPLATDHWIEAAFTDKGGLIMYELEEVLYTHLKPQFRS